MEIRLRRLAAGSLSIGLAAAIGLASAGPASAITCGYKSYKDAGDQAYAATYPGCIEARTKARYELSATGNTVWTSWNAWTSYNVQGYIVSYSVHVGAANEVTGGQTEVEYSSTPAPTTLLAVVSH